MGQIEKREAPSPKKNAAVHEIRISLIVSIFAGFSSNVRFVFGVFVVCVWEWAEDGGAAFCMRD